MNTLRKASLLGLVALAAVSMAQDKKTLRLTLKPGMVVTHTSVTDGKFTIAGPADQTVNNKTTMTQEFAFDAGEAGWFKFNCTTTDFKSEGEQMDMGMGATSPEEIAAAVKKVKFAGEVNELGSVRNVAVQGQDNLDMMTKQMMNSVTDQMNQIGFFAMVLPQEEVGVGSKWTKTYDMAKSMEAIPFFKNVAGKMPVEFTLEAFESRDGMELAKVKAFMDGKATFDLDFGGGGGSGSMTTTSNGTIWINLATGLPVSSDTKLANNIDFGMGTMQQEMSIKGTFKVK